MTTAFVKKDPKIADLEPQFVELGADFNSEVATATKEVTTMASSMRTAAAINPTEQEKDLISAIYQALLDRLIALKAAKPSKTKAGKVIEVLLGFLKKINIFGKRN